MTDLKSWGKMEKMRHQILLKRMLKMSSNLGSLMSIDIMQVVLNFSDVHRLQTSVSTFTDSKLRPWYVPIVSILKPSVSGDKSKLTQNYKEKKEKQICN